jgi:hypothetical protein
MTSLDRAFTVVMQNSPKTDGRTYIVVRDPAEQPGTRARLASTVAAAICRSGPFRPRRSPTMVSGVKGVMS